MLWADIIVIATFLLGTVLFIGAAVNALYFHFRYQKALDRNVMKEKYYDGGLLMGLNCLMVYGHYCFSPSRAKRDGVLDVFERLDRRQKLHLKFHWVAIVANVLVYFGGYIYAKARGMID